jgi:hypothetical protein
VIFLFSTAAALWLCLALTLNPTLASSQPTRPTMAEWIILVKAYSLAYGVDPNLSLALAEVEGSGEGCRFRFGRYGKYDLPFGLDYRCKVPRADTPGGNAEGGIKALAGHLRRQGSLHAALRKYNSGDSPAQFERYFRRIKYLEKQNRMARVFD